MIDILEILAGLVWERLSEKEKKELGLEGVKKRTVEQLGAELRSVVNRYQGSLQSFPFKDPNS